MTKKLSTAYLSLLASLSIIGCGNSGDNLQTPQAASIIQDGPVNYVGVMIALDEKTVPKTGVAVASVVGVEETTNAKSIQNKTAANGSAESDAGTALSISGGIIGVFCPPAGAALGATGSILSAFGANSGTVYLQSQINDINQTLVLLQNQVNEIQTEINMNNAYYDSFVKQTTKSFACQALQQYYKTIETIYDVGIDLNTSSSCLDGYISPNSTNAIGNQFQENIDGNVTSAIQSATTVQNLITLANKNNFSNGSVNSNNNFQSYVDGLSISELNSSSATYPPLGSSVDFKNITSGTVIQSQVISPASSCASTDASSSTAMLLACNYQYFVENMLPIPGTQSSNVVTSINQYNQILLQIYQQNVLSLQYAYNIEATSNYINYQNYVSCLSQNSNNKSSCTANQIPSWYGLLETTFAVGAPSSTGVLPIGSSVSTNNVNTPELAETYFITAQQNLILAYAKRVNILYKNLMNFIISDPLASTQSYTSPPSKTNYTIYGQNVEISFPQQSSLYKTISAATLKSSTNDGQILGAALNSSTGGLFYQYGGINQLYSCSGPSNITPATSSSPALLNLSNCKSAFPDSNVSYFDGVNMQAYGVNNNGIAQTNTLNLYQSCNQANSSTNLPIAWNGNVLMCSTWAGSNFINSSTLPGCNNGTSALQNVAIDTTFGGGFGNFAPIGPANLAYSFPASSPGFTLVASGSSACNNDNINYVIGTSGGYFYQSDSSPWTITDNGYGGGHNPTGNHDALLQITLPNGYIFPFYIYSTSSNIDLPPDTDDYTLATPVCPNNMGTGLPSGILYCTQQPNGQISVATNDGGIYTVSAWQVNNITGYTTQYMEVQTNYCVTTVGNTNGIGTCSNANTPKPSGSYSQSCSNIEWLYPILSASCTPNNDYTSINYSTCATNSTISNINGFLTCDTPNPSLPNGSYTLTCSNIAWQLPMLSAFCTPNMAFTSIDYSTCATNSTISNMSGTLTCDTPQ